MPDTAAPTVLVADDGPIRIITLNRPERRNAIDLVLRVDLAEAVEAAMADAGVRVLVITGAGATFCSGGDISTMQRQPAERTRPRVEAVQRVVRAIWAGPKPVVAAVEGAAFGAGLALALACDRVVAASDAILSASFARVGLAGDMGIFASLPARLGTARAKQLLMFATRVSGTDALAMGLVDAVADPGGVLDAALADARALAAGPPNALAQIKAVLGDLPRDPLQVLDLEVEVAATLFESDDLAEGAASFREHRPPNFAGIALGTAPASGPTRN
jgi:2-(1,2-epoxy-1,2-dihydrophenyl)acetyl-CoA isomerase